jgi:hypothetical protein
MAQTQDEIRGDLIRRLFAVAISVGAATTLARMDWVEKGHWPTLAEWQQLAILSVAMTATVLSWDGYLMSIEDRPLKKFWRFAIDITLVFVYMFLLMTSHHKTWWIPIHAITYALYIIWDFLTVREYTAKYYMQGATQKQTIFGVYWGGLRDVDKVSRGPVITLGWAAYFWGLFLINRHGLEDRVFITAIFAIAGLVLYRRDKRKRYASLYRFVVVAALLVADLLYVKCGSARIGDQQIWLLAQTYI